MFILGQDHKDVGDQLEDLTKRILERLGHRNVVVSSKASGGHEIDVEAEFPIPRPGDSLACRVICECKAVKDPIDTTDWLKFLGKVLLERATTTADVHGLFIALNGVNGNVAGSYAKLKEEDRTITLLSGDQLAETLRATFDMTDKDSVIKKLKGWTRRSWSRVEPAFSGGKIYWVIRFEDESCTFLSASGDFPSEAEIVRFSGPVKRVTSSGEFANMAAEAAQTERMSGICVELIVRAMEHGELSKPLQGIQDYTEAEIQKALEILTDKGIIIQKESAFVPTFAEKQDAERVADFAALAQFAFGGKMVIAQLSRLAKSQYYDPNFNDSLLALVAQRQGGLPIPTDQNALILDILKISPSALLYALQPDPIIVQHRTSATTDEQMDRSDVKTFLNHLFRCLFHDFTSAAFTQYLYEVRGLREIDVTRRIALKTDQGLMREWDLRERRGIGQWSQEHGGGFLTILILEDAPEPWEWAAKK